MKKRCTSLQIAIIDFQHKVLHFNKITLVILYNKAKNTFYDNYEAFKEGPFCGCVWMQISPSVLTAIINSQ